MQVTEFIAAWVRDMSHHKPGSAGWYRTGTHCLNAYDREFAGRSKVRTRSDVFATINRDARKLYEERRRSIKGRDGSIVWIDEFADPWGPNGRYGAALAKWKVMDESSGAYRARDKAAELAMSYGEGIVEQATQDLAMSGNVFIKFNTEGEKQMEKIDWHKPLRARDPVSGLVQPQEVYTYKSGKQRVVWIDDRVYPVDEQGRMMATVQYPGWGRRFPGQKIVENVPEEKFFLGLAREPDGTYWLTDGGTMSDRGVMDYWKRLMTDQPHWIVDTRKSAEPPKAHDPKDWAVVFHGDEDDSAACDEALMTKTAAELRSSGMGTAVRVRTTPAPVDTARYIQLYRRAGTNEAWRINALDGRQEFTWERADKKSGWNEYVNVKVRD